MLRRRWPVVLFVPWTVYVWVTRIVNALGDDTANVPLAVTLSLSVLVPTVFVGVVLVRSRDRALTGTEARLWLATGGWTALVWLVRGAEIVLSDHEVAFKIVHVVVGGVSIALAAATMGVARRELAGEPDDPTDPAAGVGRPTTRVSPPTGAGR
jgi:hypothetical protein